ncbi:MAG: TIGR00159 family protein, partial [Clostridiales bacterium]|nr:TIGR00159 family protein [Clostridiales bacterium]
MAQFAAFWTKIASLISTMRIPDIVDILLVAYLIYKLIMLIRKTNSYRVARGIVLILIALWLSGVLKLTMINYLLEKMVELGLIALVILFQPELRRLLERMGGNIPSLFGSKRLNHLTTETEITQTIMACADMSATHTGALIVFERAN